MNDEKVSVWCGTTNHDSTCILGDHSYMELLNADERNFLMTCQSTTDIKIHFDCVELSK